MHFRYGDRIIQFEPIESFKNKYEIFLARNFSENFEFVCGKNVLNGN